MNNIQQGWQCPVCKRIYAPHIPSCHECNKQVVEFDTRTVSSDDFPKPITISVKDIVWGKWKPPYPMGTTSITTSETLKDITVWYRGYSPMCAGGRCE